MAEQQFNVPAQQQLLNDAEMELFVPASQQRIARASVAPLGARGPNLDHVCGRHGGLRGPIAACDCARNDRDPVRTV